MLLLRRWDETLAGKTQGKTILMHEASLQLELFLVCPCREPLKHPVLSHLCVCLCGGCCFPKRAPLLKLSDGWSRTSKGCFFFFFALYLTPGLLQGQDNGSRWSLTDEWFNPGFLAQCAL